MPGTLSTVTRVTARSISRKTYQAIALANTVKPAREKNARKSLVLMPNRECCASLPTAVCLGGDRVLSISIEEAWAVQLSFRRLDPRLGTSTPARGSCHLTSALLNLSTALKLPSGWITVR